jgi:hypothetical protein
MNIDYGNGFAILYAIPVVIMVFPTSGIARPALSVNTMAV